MSKEREDKYEAPDVAEEYRLIRAALARETPERAWQGPLTLPLDGRISTRYGVQRYRNGKRVGIHKGLDISAPLGSPLHAANAGVVALRRQFGLHGNTLVIDHGHGIVGLYLHLHDFAVSEGQHVQPGQLLGHVGSTGVATSPTSTTPSTSTAPPSTRCAGKATYYNRQSAHFCEYSYKL